MNDFLVFINFKTFFFQDTLENFLQELRKKDCQRLRLVLAPSFIHFAVVKKSLNLSQVAAQTCIPEGPDQEEPGVTARQLRDFQVDWLLVGHHERRQLNSENLAEILTNAQENSLKVVLAFGENDEEKNAGFSEDVFQKQLEVLTCWTQNWENLFLAYQPVWAFGSGKKVKIEDVSDVRSRVFRLLERITSCENLKKVKFLLEGPDFLKGFKDSGLVDGIVLNENGDWTTFKVLESLLD